MNLRVWLREKFSSFDSVGTGVSLNYDKKSTHGTAIGGICSILA